MKTLRRVLAMILIACMCMALLPMQILATGLTTTESTTTTTTTDADGNTVVTVTINKNTTGTDENGANVNREETRTETTTSNEDGFELGFAWTEDGTEHKEWTEEDDGSAAGQPKVNVALKPGESTSADATTTATTEGADGTTTTTTTDRTVTAETGEAQTRVDKTETTLEGLQSELKFDRDSTADQTQQRKDRDLYTDNGHFTDPASVTVSGTSEAYPFQYVGTGDYSGHYVSYIRVIYERDEDGNAIKDEDGNYVIKELQHANGTVLTKGGVPTTDLNGPYDQTTGTRPLQFLLMNEAGDAVYAYCIDLETPTTASNYYQVGNLEDNDYYASEDAEMHVRNIVTNGYWGTAEGTGSITKIRSDLKQAVAAGLVDKEYDITFVIRGVKYTGQELAEGEYVGNGYVCRHVTEHIVLTDEVIDGFTEGEALDATQCAIWSFANGSKLTLDGEDSMIVGDVTYASCALGDSRNGQNDYAGAARTLAFYNYLISLENAETSTIVINDKNNVEDMNLTVGDKVAGHAKNNDDNADNDVYNVELNFTLAFIPDPTNDDLLVHLTYTVDGEEVTVIRRLAGENTEDRTYDSIAADENGVYTLSGLQLSENEEFTFDLRLEGMQYLERGVYIYTAEGGIGRSQTMVGLAEGTNTVDVSKSVTIKFDVDENNHVVADRTWHNEGDPTSTPNGGNEQPTGGNNVPVLTTLYNIEEEAVPLASHLSVNNELVEILDEEVPLAAVPETGDHSVILVLAIIATTLLLGATFIVDKKRAAVK